MNLRTKFHLASSCLILTVVVGMMLSLLVYEKKRLRAESEQQQLEELDKFARVCEAGPPCTHTTDGYPPGGAGVRGVAYHPGIFAPSKLVHSTSPNAISSSA